MIILTLAKLGGHMSKGYRHPELGYFHRLDLAGGSVATSLVPDAALAGLVQYLNEAEAQREGKRIIRIAQEMLELEKIEKPVWGETKEEREFSSGPNARPAMVSRGGRGVVNPLLRRISPDKYRRQREIEQREILLNRELAQHGFSPYTWFSTTGHWIVTWQIQSRAPEKHKVHRGVMQLDDGAALQMILDLARAGYLNRLRRCSHCGGWLYAKFRHQHFCSTKCQQRHYTTGEDWKAHRREYMRRYYQMRLKSVVRIPSKAKGKIP
jgi:hypothetical protein